MKFWISLLVVAVLSVSLCSVSTAQDEKNTIVIEPVGPATIEQVIAVNQKSTKTVLISAPVEDGPTGFFDTTRMERAKRIKVMGMMRLLQIRMRLSGELGKSNEIKEMTRKVARGEKDMADVVDFLDDLIRWIIENSDEMMQMIEMIIDIVMTIIDLFELPPSVLPLPNSVIVQ